MLKKKTFELLRRVVNFSYLIGSFPYSWKSLKGPMTFNGSFGRRTAFLAQFALYLTYESFIICRWAQAKYFDPSATKKRIIGLQYIALSYALPIPMQISTLLMYGRHHLYVNRLICHCEDFDSKLVILV